MNRRKAIRHEFVDYVPEELEDGVVYVSIRYSTAVHLCCCGCGIEVASPISPADWELTFDGESITLHPSIGNWSLPCRSHYWIRRNHVQWARSWTAREIAAGRKRDQMATEARFGAKAHDSTTDDLLSEQEEAGIPETMWNRMVRALSKFTRF